MDKLRIGVVGVGNVGTAHATAFYQGMVTDGVLSALCDTDPIRAERLKTLFPGVPVFSSHTELFASGSVDALIIATPHYAHPLIAMDAFSYGLHVLSEKPIGVFCKNAREAVALAEKKGLVYGVMFNQRCNKLFKLAKKMCEDGVIGELKRSVWIITNWYRKQAYYESGSWRASWRGEGGGVLLNQAPHNLDLWQWICGMPSKITAECKIARFHDIEVEDEATILASYENGATGVFLTSTGDYPGTNRFEITGTKGTLLLEGGRLTHTQLSLDERTFCFSDEAVKNELTVTTVEDEPYNGHLEVLCAFVRSVLYEEALVATAREALNELSISNAAYLSAWEGRAVELPINDDHFLSGLEERTRASEARWSETSASSATGKYKSRWKTNW